MGRALWTARGPLGVLGTSQWWLKSGEGICFFTTSFHQDSDEVLGCSAGDPGLGVTRGNMGSGIPYWAFLTGTAVQFGLFHRSGR